LNKCQTARIVLRYRYLQILSVCSQQKRDSARERRRKPHAELSRVVPLRRDKGYWLDVERRENKIQNTVDLLPNDSPLLTFQSHLYAVNQDSCIYLLHSDILVWMKTSKENEIGNINR